MESGILILCATLVNIYITVCKLPESCLSTWPQNMTNGSIWRYAKISHIAILYVINCCYYNSQTNDLTIEYRNEKLTLIKTVTAWIA